MGRPDMAYFRIASALQLKKTFKLFGDGAVRRDFTYVGDVVNSVVALLENLNHQNAGFHDVVNVGGGKPCSMHDLISTLEKIANKKLAVEYAEDIPQDVQTTVADTRKQSELIGQIPGTSLEEGLRAVWEWIGIPHVNKSLESWTTGGIH